MNASGAITLEAPKIITTFDIQKPEVRAKFFRTKGNQGMNFFALLEALGYSRPVAARKTKQYEEDWIHQSIHLGNTMTNTGTANQYTFTLGITDPNIDYLEQNTTSPYNTNAQYVFPIKQWDEITLPENNAKLLVTGYVISGSTCTVTVMHINPAAGPFTLANYVAGFELIITGNAFSVGSDQTEGQVNKPLIDYNYLKISKTTYNIPGSQLADQIWFDQYSDGRGIEGYYIVGQNNTEYEHALTIDSALLFDALNEISVVDPTTNEPIYTTEGLDPYMKRKGSNIPYTPGSFSVSLFDYMDKILDQQGAPSWMAGLVGIDLDNEKDNVLKSYFGNNDTTSMYLKERAQADLFGGNAGLAMEVNFRYLEKGSRTWGFTRMPQFNMAKLYGAAGYNTPRLGLFFPIGTKPDKNNPNNMIPYMGMTYRAQGDYSRKAEVYHVNGAGPGLKVQSKDVNKLVMRSEYGAEHCGGNCMIRLYQA